MANFNLSIDGGQLLYKDAAGNTYTIGSATMIAPAYTKTTYAAKSLVTHDGKLYTNTNAIVAAEDWTAAHWTETTVAAWTASL